MRLTFRGWLLSYCQELTGLKTTSVKKLVSAVEESAPHASAAVFLLAVEARRVADLISRTSDPELLAGRLPGRTTMTSRFAIAR